MANKKKKMFFNPTNIFYFEVYYAQSVDVDAGAVGYFVVKFNHVFLWTAEKETKPNQTTS